MESEIESLLLEANLIQKYKPIYNVRFTDGKVYPMIKITIKDKYPRVLFTRRVEDKDSLYFGPYPNVGAIKTVLKIVRRIFPFQSVKNHPKKICLYNHLGLCPCPEVLEDTSYMKNIKHLVDFLKGDTKKVVKELEKELKDYSKREEYEKAMENQKKLESIKLVTSLFYHPLEYEENPNLRYDLRIKELSELKNLLNEKGMKIDKIHRIECFDVSIISSKHATGSMVVFTQGEKDSRWYRRFKIRYDRGIPNDFSMIKEVIFRRLNHPEWPAPDLIIVDGGKGQVSSALSVLKDKKFNVPLIGLAKKEETIVTSNLEEINLPKDSSVLHLLMRIRDEAHRFAITYHRKLRSRHFLETS